MTRIILAMVAAIAFAVYGAYVALNGNFKVGIAAILIAVANAILLTQ